MGCCSSKSFEDLIENVMSQFYFRIIRHELIVADIEEFLNKPIKTYYEFLSVTKNVGLHEDVYYQTTLWEKCYVTHVDKHGIDGLLFIPLLLCQGDMITKLEYIKQYLSVNINRSKEHNSVLSLTIHLKDFQNIIFTYLSCLTSIAVETYCVTNKMEDLYANDTNSVYNEKNREMDKFRNRFASEQILNFTKELLKPYSKKNYYVNAGKFLEDNIPFLTNDKHIRKQISLWYEKRKEQDDAVNKMEESLKEAGTNFGIGDDGDDRDDMGSRGENGINLAKTNTGFSS